MVAGTGLGMGRAGQSEGVQDGTVHAHRSKSGM